VGLAAGHQVDYERSATLKHGPNRDDSLMVLAYS
jgi:hypothetical protein